MDKSTISMAIFNSYVSLPERVPSSEHTTRRSGRRGSSIEKRHHMNPSQRHQFLPVNWQFVAKKQCIMIKLIKPY